MEFLRGNFAIKGNRHRSDDLKGVLGKFQDCVKRRAALSVSLNPNCKESESKAYVEKMFPKCFQDTAPFDRIP